MAERPALSSNNQSGQHCPPPWTELNELSSNALGGKVLFSTDDWFAPAEMLLSSDAAVWKEGFTEQGKWMDGWETRRKRIPGHDWCIIKLGLPGTIFGIQLDTSFFTGNFAPRASIQAARLEKDVELERTAGERGTAATVEQLEAASNLQSEKWETLVEMTSLGAGYKDTCNSYFTVGGPSGLGPFTHVRLNIFPDGGVARCRVFGVASSSPSDLCSTGDVDLVSVKP